jgi:hypothetical protein
MVREARLAMNVPRQNVMTGKPVAPTPLDGYAIASAMEMPK